MKEIDEEREREKERETEREREREREYFTRAENSRAAAFDGVVCVRGKGS